MMISLMKEAMIMTSNTLNLYQTEDYRFTLATSITEKLKTQHNQNSKSENMERFLRRKKANEVVLAIRQIEEMMEQVQAVAELVKRKKKWSIFPSFSTSATIISRTKKVDAVDS